ncbi:flagellar export protein FliJ [Nocardioides sp. Kera G14]|uniref:flagellar export protein FliJ n=1 Tax=Nocardioides sp. Kera G14 TaxID=2884264 RepID=UPI001D10F1D7|nr:flagellar export protein FliJ [Nocardioides sp. Kera G14]UDY24066.1 flagellar export protein FliJ [Nocardioides sp. Kera G14]
MSVRTGSADRGLSAVARVRGVKESESLLVLQHALIEQREREERLAQLQAQLRAAAALEAEILGAGTPGALLTLQMNLGQLNDSIQQARSEIAVAEHITESARSRWESDKTQLSAVEQLLERRADERRVERDRLIAKDADDLAGQAWARNREAGDA